MKKIATILLVLASTLIASCTTQQATTQQTTASQIDGDIYIGNETIKYLADGVPDRIFFATNKYNISSKGTETLLKTEKTFKTNVKHLRSPDEPSRAHQYPAGHLEQRQPDS